MDSTLIIVILGAAVAGFVQGLSGFAFGMVAMSFWVWTIDPRMASAMTVFGALTGQLLAAFSVRRGLSLRRLWPFVAGGLVGIPIGAAILPALNAQLFKAVFGAFLTLWCPVMLMARRLPAITHGGRVADGVAGAAGGVMGGIGGFTGVIPTLWCTLRGFDKDEQRAVIQNFNLATLAVTMATYVGKGIVTREMLPMFLVVAPAMLVPTVLGTRVYLGIGEATFRKIVLTLLTASGVVVLASSLPGWLVRP
ncbi:sulfite exporter TauE/SafE family protein [Cupriavidus pinatubonensis]|uniref:sulfite exporter TauE/SafE family protein n=1 Tax=Cupriavidus pinatubonensis TaxID=248026 RepID=UPI001CC760A9|nr:sulfite exporter TauE/SafE family protein [Cupriavidus pinatubonensis]